VERLEEEDRLEEDRLEEEPLEEELFEEDEEEEEGEVDFFLVFRVVFLRPAAARFLAAFSVAFLRCSIFHSEPNTWLCL